MSLCKNHNATVFLPEYKTKRMNKKTSFQFKYIVFVLYLFKQMQVKHIYEPFKTHCLGPDYEM